MEWIKKKALFSMLLLITLFFASGCQSVIAPSNENTATSPAFNTTLEPSLTSASNTTNLLATPTPTPVPSSTPNPSENPPSPTSLFPTQISTLPKHLFTSYVFDKERGLVYAFGGSSYDECNPCDKTWVWDFKEWKSIEATVHPEGRSGATFAYDPIRKVSVLFGGIDEHGKFLNDTWLWNGKDWVSQDSELSPSPRSGTNMVFDEAHQVIFLFGGIWNETNSRASTILNDVWIWDGNHWTEIRPPTEDGGQSFLAYDVDKQQIIRMSYSKMYTWDWSEKVWVYSNLENTPFFVQGAMAYDSSHHQLMLLSEDLSPNDYHPAGWLWNGDVWSRAPLPAGLVGVASVSLIDDPLHQGLLLFGYRQYTVKGHHYNSAWFWNGTDWTSIY